MMFTVNPSFPHPDQEPGEPQPWTMAEAVAFAVKTLRNDRAGMMQRQQAANILKEAFDSIEE